MLLPLSIIFSEEKEEKNDELIIGSVSRSRWINNKIISSIYYILLTFVFLREILVFKKEVFYYLPGFYSLFRAWGIWQEIYI